MQHNNADATNPNDNAVVCFKLNMHGGTKKTQNGSKEDGM
jgi:hypothetical protein